MAPENAEQADAATPRWMRLLITGGVMLAVLLLGAAAGMVIRGDGGGPTTPGPASVAVGFGQDMTVHHRQAVLMAGIARDHSADPAVRALAYDIELNQQAQIGRMQGWLSLWNSSPSPTGKHMTWMAADRPMGGMGDGGEMGVAEMPGMASSAEIARLQRASGPRLDVLFLQLMVRHHQGGVAMLRDAAARAEPPQVRNLAARMLEAQTAETATMIAMLADRAATPLR